MHAHLLGAGRRASRSSGRDPRDARGGAAAHDSTCAQADPECDLDYVPPRRRAPSRRRARGHVEFRSPSAATNAVLVARRI
jgi:hypothetical protein